MALPWIHGRVVVVVPGKPVPLSDGSQPGKRFLVVKAIDTNTGSVTVGNRYVNASDGNYNALRLTTLEKKLFDFSATGQTFDLAEVFVDAEVANEGIVFEAH